MASVVLAAKPGQKPADLSTHDKRKQGVARAWRGFFETYQGPAATLIQATWRGHAVRKRLRSKQKGRLLQHVPVRSREARDAAARVIQRFWRGYHARQVAEERRHAIVCIQAAMRGYLVRKHFPRLRRQWRGRNEAAITVQRFARGYLARIRYGKQQPRSKLLAVRWGKAGASVLLTGKQVAVRDHAATTIQRHYRGWKGRKRAVWVRAQRAQRVKLTTYLAREAAARKIQAAVRGWRVRRSLHTHQECSKASEHRIVPSGGPGPLQPLLPSPLAVPPQSGQEQLPSPVLGELRRPASPSLMPRPPLSPPALLTSPTSTRSGPLTGGVRPVPPPLPPPLLRRSSSSSASVSRLQAPISPPPPAPLGSTPPEPILAAKQASPITSAVHMATPAASAAATPLSPSSPAPVTLEPLPASPQPLSPHTQLPAKQQPAALAVRTRTVGKTRASPSAVAPPKVAASEVTRQVPAKQQPAELDVGTSSDRKTPTPAAVSTLPAAPPHGLPHFSRSASRRASSDAVSAGAHHTQLLKQPINVVDRADPTSVSSGSKPQPGALRVLQQQASSGTTGSGPLKARAQASVVPQALKRSQSSGLSQSGLGLAPSTRLQSRPSNVPAFNVIHAQVMHLQRSAAAPSRDSAT